MLRALRPVRVPLVAVLAAAVTLAIVAIAPGSPARHHTAPKPVTIETALAAFGGQTKLYLEIPDLPGDSVDAQHENQIDVDRLSWGVSNPKPAASASGKAASKATFTDLTLGKGIDSASPLLLKAVANGTNFSFAHITAVKPVGEGAIEFASIDLQGVNVASMKQSANRADGFDEEITLHFTRITLSYTKQLDNGATSTTSACFDLQLRRNCPVAP